MKNLLFSLLVWGCLFSTNSFSQKLDSASLAGLSPEARQQVDAYLKKANTSKYIGFGLLLVGGVMEVLAITHYSNQPATGDWSDILPDPDGTTYVFAGIGIASFIVSIPFFVDVHDYREKARALVYGAKPITLAPNLVLPNTSSYGITIAIPLGK